MMNQKKINAGFQSHVYGTFGSIHSRAKAGHTSGILQLDAIQGIGIILSRPGVKTLVQKKANFGKGYHPLTIQNHPILSMFRPSGNRKGTRYSLSKKNQKNTVKNPNNNFHSNKSY